MRPPVAPAPSSSSPASVTTNWRSASSPWPRSTKAPSARRTPQATLLGLRAFLSEFVILPLTDPIVARFARLRAALRQQGQLIPDMDLFIAATALAEDLTLVTRNVRRFARLSELKVYQPS